MAVASGGRGADWIGVPRHTFSAVLGAVTVSGRDNAEVFGYFRSGFDLEHERELREKAGRGENITDDDLYPDVRQALARLRELGFWVGIAGNQTARAGEQLRALDLPADAVATSGEWGVAKPSAAFFDRVAEMTGRLASEVTYVGITMTTTFLLDQQQVFGRCSFGAAHGHRGTAAFMVTPSSGHVVDHCCRRKSDHRATN